MFFGKVAVLMGGETAEREVSLNSGKAVLESLKRQGIDAHGLDTKDNFVERLQREGFSRVFIALHGGHGEGGQIQGLLDILGIPYTGSKLLGSAISLDKMRSKKIWFSLGLPTPPAMLLDDNSNHEDIIKLYGFPLIVKPVTEGSTFGVHKVLSVGDLKEAYKDAKKYGPVMLEQFIVGDEYTVGILGDRALPSIQIVPENQMYDYNAKYNSNTTKYICPSPLHAKQETHLQKLAVEAFKATGAEAWGRVDFIRDLNGDFWILEVNTVPGFTKTSLVPKAAEVVGLSFDNLVLEILCQTLSAKEKAAYLDTEQAQQPKK